MKTLTPSDKLAFSIPETQEIIGIGRSLLYREIAAGRLETRKIGRRTVITRQAIEAFLNGRQS